MNNSHLTATVLPVTNFDGIFCDAWVIQADRIVFASLWGRASRMMAFYGAVTTGSLSMLTIGDTHMRIERDLDKRQTRMPKHSRYGSDCLHVIVFADIIIREAAAKRILLDLNKVCNERLWAEVKNLSSLALLPHWKQILLPVMREAGMIATLASHGLSAELVDLSNEEDYESLLRSMIRNGRLGKTEGAV